MAATSRGKAGGELERTQGWSRSDGYYTLRRWNGTKNYIQGLQISVQLGADSYEITNDGPLYFLTARYSKVAGAGGAVAEAATEVWELDGEDFTKHIFTSATVAALVAVNDDITRQIEKAVDSGESFASFAWSYGSLSAAQQATVKRIFNLIKDGTDSYRSSSYVLRRIRRASPAFSFGAEANVNKVYARALLLSAYPTIPSDIQTGMPSGGFWLKGTPSRKQSSDNKFDHVVEFVYADSYSTDLYTAAT